MVTRPLPRPMWGRVAPGLGARPASGKHCRLPLTADTAGPELPAAVPGDLAVLGPTGICCPARMRVHWEPGL